MLDEPNAYRSIRFEDPGVRIYFRDTAIVTGVNVLEGATAHDHDVIRVRFTDVFVRSHGRWRAVPAHETLRTDSRGEVSGFDEGEGSRVA